MPISKGGRVGHLNSLVEMVICTAEGENGSLNNSSTFLKTLLSVSDNKGPILSAAFAISDLRRKLALGLDVVMLIEGEEENGSRGFKDAIHQLKVRIPLLILGHSILISCQEVIGHIDAIILCNSYWIGEDTPCITYGLRGVIHCSLEVGRP